MNPPEAPRLRPRVLVTAFAVLAVALLAGLLVGPVSLPVGGVLAEVADRLPLISISYRPRDVT